MTGYTILNTENLPDSLKNKPRWMICILFTAGLFVMTLSATAAGIFIGYTYCYVEHRTGFRATDNISQTENLHIFNVPKGERIAKENTINGALLSSQLVRRIVGIGQTLLNDNHVYFTGSKNEKHL